VARSPSSRSAASGFDCVPPSALACTKDVCACTPVFVGPVGPEDSCALVMTLIVAGVKKALLTCWVDG